MGRYRDNPGETLLTKLNVPDSSFSFIKVSAAGREAILPLGGHADTMTVQSHLLGKYIIFTCDQPGTGLQLTGQQPSGVGRIKRRISGSNQSYLSAGEVDNGPLTVSLQINNDTLWHNRMEIARLLPAQNQRFYWFDSSLILEKRDNALFDTTLIEVKQYRPDSMIFNIPFHGNILEILPDDISLLSSVNIQIKTGILPEDKKWAVFTLKEDELSYISSTMEADYFTFQTNSFGKYTIASDTVAPLVQIRSPENGKSYRKNPEINFSMTDDLSGVDGEEGVSLVIDSSFVLPEWDPEEDLVRAIIDNPLAPGEHSLYIEVKDFLQNTVRDTIHFQIY
jgi:hypothetical protein